MRSFGMKVRRGVKGEREEKRRGGKGERRERVRVESAILLSFSQFLYKFCYLTVFFIFLFVCFF